MLQEPRQAHRHRHRSATCTTLCARMLVYVAGCVSNPTASSLCWLTAACLLRTHQKLQERGEKINAVHDDSNKLQSATEQWLRQCEEMARQQKEKKWWEF